MLGSVQVDDGRADPIGSARERFVLAVLLLGAGRPASVSRLIDALWDDPPRSAKAQLHNMISNLRRRVGEERIVTGPAGYELRLGEATLDVLDFRRLAAEGQRARAGGDAAVAVALLGEALALWRGPALADVPDELATATRHALHEERLVAAEARFEAQLTLGRHADVLRDLEPLLAEHPFRETLHQARMVALLGTGRRGDALVAYREAHRRFVDGLGIEPGPALRDLEGQLRRGEDLTPTTTPTVVARQLPPVTAVLTGRDGLIDEITGSAAPVRVLVGPGGVGKTTVALAVAGRLAASFPDGQLYADLRGSQESPADPHAILGRFLAALGVRQSTLPQDRAERVAMYRGVLARTRTLVVLDDAAGEEQLRTLVPDDPGCVALVTSRRQLAGTARWTVPVLAEEDCLELLGRIVGQERTSAEPAAATELAAVCGRLPLAVSIVAARLAVRPDWTLDELRGRLAEERHRLDELAVGDLDVRASIALSYRTLSPRARRLFRLLGLVRAADWPVWVPRVLLGEPAGDLVAELVDVHLVAPLGADAAGQDRFRLHDLVADYAREQAREHEPDAAAASTRLLAGWLALAAAADERIPHGEGFAVPASTGAPPVAVTAPYDWFDAERAGLLGAIEEAVRLGRPDLAGQLALRMSGYLKLRCDYDDWLAALRLAIDPVRAAGLDHVLVKLLSALFVAHGLADRYDEQVAVAEEELAVARRLGDRGAEVVALAHTGRAVRDLDERRLPPFPPG